VPGTKLPRFIKEKVTVTGVVLATPEVKLAFSQVGIPEIAKLRLSVAELS